MHVTAIVVAAGKGLRLKSRIPKPLLEVNGKPIIIYSLEVLSRDPAVKDIIVVVSSRNKEAIASVIKRYRIPKIKKIVLGGRQRKDSVAHGLRAMNSCTELVLIHDAARPFINSRLVSAVIEEAEKEEAAILGVTVKPTIKKVKRQRSKGKSQFIVEQTINRDNLMEIQTPQVFRKILILKAYNKFSNIAATDDATLVEKLGKKVKLIMGSTFNIKITTPEDLVFARAIARVKV